MPFSDVAEWMPELSRYRQAGFDVVHVNVGDSDVPLEGLVRTTAAYRAWLRERPDEYVIVSTAADIDAARASGRLAVCFDIEGAHAFGTELSLVPMFYDLGVRWLLMAYDRSGPAALNITHDAIARILGTRRASVTIVAGKLQKAGAIRYSRGMVSILDRQVLQHTACECYETIVAAHNIF